MQCPNSSATIRWQTNYQCMLEPLCYPTNYQCMLTSRLGAQHDPHTCKVA